MIMWLQWLYENEINFTISAFFDGGIDIKLGDTMNGWKAEHTFDADDIDEGLHWLVDKAIEHYPALKGKILPEGFEPL